MLGKHLQLSIRAIAKQLGRAPSSISREIARNNRGRGYRAHLAQKRAEEHRHLPRRSRKTTYGPLQTYIDNKLRLLWSPEQISGRLGYEQAPPRMRVCHETIYQYMIESAKAGKDYSNYLRQGHLRHSYGWRGKHRFKRIHLDAKTIEERPAEVEDRSRAGDWENDSVRGPQRSRGGIATSVERKTRYLVAAKLENRSAREYNRALIAAFRSQPALPLHTMTVDNGMEFSQFPELEKELKTQVYFAHPYCSWERGTNENTNGLLRQIFKKGSDLTGVHPGEITKAAALLNNRPRKCLGYRTPAEAMEAECWS
jgi:IS30 family transposase